MPVFKRLLAGMDRWLDAYATIEVPGGAGRKPHLEVL